jgi:hypothetical protein
MADEKTPSTITVIVLMFLAAVTVASTAIGLLWIGYRLIAAATT